MQLNMVFIFFLYGFSLFVCLSFFGLQNGIYVMHSVVAFCKKRTNDLKPTDAHITPL